MKPTRILIADDHPIIRHGLANLVSAYADEWEVCALAADGRQALREALTYRPRVVVMEKRLTSAEILIYTGTTSPHTLLEIFRSSVCGFLLKSEAVEALFPALSSLREHHLFRSCGARALCEKIMAGEGLYQTLTPREREILQLIAQSKKAREIARDLGVSGATIQTHCTNLYRKLSVGTAREAARYAYEHGLVELTGN